MNFTHRNKLVKYGKVPGTDPIPLEVDLLFQHLHKILRGSCTLTGSSVLEKYIKEMSPRFRASDESAVDKILHCTSNDVDMFVPDNPARFCKWGKCGGHSFYSDILPKVFFELQQTHGLTPTKVRRTCISEDDDYGAFQYFNGLVSKIEFRIVSTTGDVVPRQIQIITLDGQPAANETWDEFVTNRFDIDICRGVYNLRSGSTVCATYSVQTQSNIRNGVFDFCLQPGKTFQQNIARMIKYRDKGFDLGTITYSNWVHPALQELFNLQLKIALAPIWLDEWQKKSRVKVPPEIIKDYVLPFLRPKSKWERRQLEHDLLLENVRVVSRTLASGDPLNRDGPKVLHPACAGVVGSKVGSNVKSDMDEGKDDNPDGIVSITSKALLAYGM